MDFWRRACGVSRLEHVQNDEIRRRVHRNQDIMDTINMKRLIWYGHVQRMPEEWWPKRMLDWVPNRRRKRGRPRRDWRENIHLKMEWRNLQPGDWENRKAWQAGCGKQRQLEQSRCIYIYMYLVESKCYRTFIILDYLMMTGVKYIVFEVFFCHCDIFSRGCTIERSIYAVFLL